MFNLKYSHSFLLFILCIWLANAKRLELPNIQPLHLIVDFGMDQYVYPPNHRVLIPNSRQYIANPSQFFQQQIPNNSILLLKTT